MLGKYLREATKCKVDININAALKVNDLDTSKLAKAVVHELKYSISFFIYYT